MANPAWRAALEANTPPVPTVPTLLVQGTDDPVVLPGSNALYVTRACAAGSTIVGDFVGKLGHMKAGFAAAPAAFTFLQLAFDGRAGATTCGTMLPVAPLAGTR
jgi:pimeloyl-ACP methyl ester carboxylesterase